MSTEWSGGNQGSRIEIRKPQLTTGIRPPTKSGHNARRWCGHTCVVYAINPGIHARPPIFTMVYVSPVLTTSHGRTRTDENGPRPFKRYMSLSLPYMVEQDLAELIAEIDVVLEQGRRLVREEERR